MIKKHVIFTHIKRHSNISVGASGLLSVPFEDVLHAVTVGFVTPYCADNIDGIVATYPQTVHCFVNIETNGFPSVKLCQRISGDVVVIAYL